MTGGIVTDIFGPMGRQRAEVRNRRGPGRYQVLIASDHSVEFGDTLYWKEGTVYWTSAATKQRNIPLVCERFMKMPDAESETPQE